MNHVSNLGWLVLQTECVQSDVKSDECNGNDVMVRGILRRGINAPILVLSVWLCSIKGFIDTSSRKIENKRSFWFWNNGFIFHYNNSRRHQIKEVNNLSIELKVNCMKMTQRIYLNTQVKKHRIGITSQIWETNHSFVRRNNNWETQVRVRIKSRLRELGEKSQYWKTLIRDKGHA